MSKAEYKKVLVLPDIHGHLHDPLAIKIVKEFSKDFQPDETILLGDFLDIESVGKFATAKAPSLKDEYAIGNHLLDILTPNVYIFGNHEDRLENELYLADQYQDLLSISHNLKLPERNIQTIPYSQYKSYKIGKMNFVHGFSCNVNAAKSEVEAFGCVTFGHTHRIQTYQHKHARHKNTGFNIGCLCKLNPDYTKNRKPHGWCNGFQFGYFLKSGNFSVYQVRIIGSEVIINGKSYRKY